MNPATYLRIELYFKDFIKTVYSCGGYVFYGQVYKYFKSKKIGLKNINKMIELKLIGQGNYNKNKYVYLKHLSLKYLKYRDIEELPEKLEVKAIRKHFRTLYSFYKFEYFLEKNVLINYDLSDKNLDIVLNKIMNLLDTNRLDNLHHIRLVKEGYIKGLHNTFKLISSRFGLYIYNFNEGESLSSSTLNFIYFDKGFNTEKNLVYLIIRKISEFLNKLGTIHDSNCCKFNVEIVTDNMRIESLKNLKDKALKGIEKRKYSNDKGYKVTGLKEITFSILDIEKYFKGTIRENLKLFKDGEFEKKLFEGGN